MDVHLPLSATIKVVNMEHKKKKITMGFALLVCAMVALVGVGYALAYQGSATVTTDNGGAETIVVAIADDNGYQHRISGTYTVNTLNDGTDIDLSNLLKNGGSAGSEYTTKYFKYNPAVVTPSPADACFTLVDSDQGYTAYEVASIPVTVKQTTGATATNVTLTMGGGADAVINQYGLSFVWVIGDTVLNSIDGHVENLDMSTGQADVVLKAFVIYSDSVPVALYGSISAFTLASGSITFTANASDS